MYDSLSTGVADVRKAKIRRTSTYLGPVRQCDGWQSSCDRQCSEPPCDKKRAAKRREPPTRRIASSKGHFEPKFGDEGSSPPAHVTMRCAKPSGCDTEAPPWVPCQPTDDVFPAATSMRRTQYDDKKERMRLLLLETLEMNCRRLEELLTQKWIEMPSSADPSRLPVKSDQAVKVTLFEQRNAVAG
jgi:hypothetical protein